MNCNASGAMATPTVTVPASRFFAAFGRSSVTDWLAEIRAPARVGPAHA